STQPEACDLRGIAVFHFQLANGGGFAAVLLDEEFQAEGLALEDLKQVEAAGHAAEVHLLVHGLAGIVLMAVSVELGAVAKNEGFQPGFEGAARRSIGNGGRRLCGSLWTRLRGQCSRQS